MAAAAATAKSACDGVLGWERRYGIELPVETLIFVASGSLRNLFPSCVRMPLELDEDGEEGWELAVCAPRGEHYAVCVARCEDTCVYLAWRKGDAASRVYVGPRPIGLGSAEYAFRCPSLHALFEMVMDRASEL